MKECPNCWGYQEYDGKPRFCNSCKCKKVNEKAIKTDSNYALLGMILSK